MIYKVFTYKWGTSRTPYLVEVQCSKISLLSAFFPGPSVYIQNAFLVHLLPLSVTLIFDIESWVLYTIRLLILYHRDVKWSLRDLVRTHCNLCVTFVSHSGKLLNKYPQFRVFFACGSGGIVWHSEGIVLFDCQFDCWPSSVPTSPEIRNFIFVWSSGVNFGTVSRKHYNHFCSST